ncbi:platelet-derived growth factor receptor alpha-like [Mytilus galloprovincialis]|uniref:platelet-derived growth factor receptor alpha-like n=1 Tax=Mytilus galloprovincialis TaxID=29158 RepID=UPI003F7B433F
MGTVAVSYNNYTCKKWVEQFHFYTEVNFPDGTMPENFCRTAKDFPRPWCYTTDNDRGWEHCNINNCTCPAGLFGYNCEYECHCADQSETCGSISGKCSSGCTEGWHGLDCQTQIDLSSLSEVCPDGTFGYSCNFQCRCHGYKVCNKKTGECPERRCAEGFWGTRCQLSNNCFYNGQANDYMGTDTVTLYNDTCQRWETQNPHPHHYKVTDFPDQAWPENFCRATPDSHRPWCYTTNETNRFDYCDINNCNCAAGQFGNNCEYECHCEDQSEACESVNGKCSSGCAQGWDGFNCQKPAFPDIKVRSTEDIYTSYNKTDSGDYVIPTGHNFTIECHGAYPPKLKVLCSGKVNDESDFVLLNITKVELTESETDRNFGALYHVDNPDFTYTGEYECYYGDNDNLGTKVYIFISDPNNLFALTWTEFVNLTIYHYRKTYLPCRVTDPSTTVKLINTAGNNEVEVGDSTAVSYDPRLGFILLYPNQFFDGQFECEAISKDGKEDSLMMVLRYLKSTSVPQPALVTSKTTVMIGEEFEIKCRVYIDRGATFSMTWSYPSERSARVHYTDPIREVKSESVDFDVLYSNLIVTKAIKSDEGAYTCTVQTNYGKQNNVSTVIHVVDFVSLVIASSVVYAEEGKRITLSADYNGNPFLPRITWWRGNNQLHNVDGNETITTMRNTTAYSITRVAKHMSGTYTVKGESTILVTKDIELVVICKPLVYIKSNKSGDFYQYKHHYTLTCNVPCVDSGDVHVWMEYSPCNISMCYNQMGHQWKNRSDVQFLKGRSLRLSYLAEQTEVIRCRAQNEVGSTTSPIEIVKIKGKRITYFGLFLLPRKTILDGI